MSLVLPTPTVTTGPEWAETLNTALELVDSHDHSVGKGTKINPNGLDINSDLPLGSNNLTNARSLRMISNASAIGGAADLRALYAVGSELYYNDGIGNQVQLTSNGGINAASVGGFGGDYTTSTALASYSSVSATFLFQQNTGINANIDAAELTIREAVASANAVKLKSPASLAASYDLTLLTALPASKLALLVDASGNLTAEEITSAQLGDNAVIPSGAIMPYAGASAPTGFLLCDGSAVSRTTYAALFAVLGNTHGQGDGSTTFNIPDYRGRFLRGTDDMGTGAGAAGRDPDAAGRTAMNTGGNAGNNVGSVQADATAKNGLTITDPGHSHDQFDNVGGTGGVNLSATNAGSTAGRSSTTSTDPAGTVLNAGDNETRPLNAYVNYIIKT
jgi:microcystin-dependent protein